MGGHYKDSQQPLNAGPVSPWITLICHDLLIEPIFQQLTGESLHERTANITDEAQRDKARTVFHFQVDRKRVREWVQNEYSRVRNRSLPRQLIFQTFSTQDILIQTNP